MPQNMIVTDTLFIGQLFTEPNKELVIPDYQRPFEWEQDKCEELWDDLIDFSFPPDGSPANPNKQYFLSHIEFTEVDANTYEIVDGKHRIISLLFMLRIFYELCKGDDFYSKTASTLENCLWLQNKDGEPDKTKPKIRSEMYNKQFNSVLKGCLDLGFAQKDAKDTLSKAFRFYEAKITYFKQHANGNFKKFITDILNRVFSVRFSLKSREDALDAFEKINTRGTPLNYTDVFKIAFYKVFEKQGKFALKQFLEDWETLNERAINTFGKFETLFKNYIYKNVTRKGKCSLKIFSERKYADFAEAECIPNLFALLDFFDDLKEQNTDRFTTDILRYAYVLLHEKDGAASYALTNYFFSQRSSDNSLDNKAFLTWLKRYTAFSMSDSLSEQKGSRLGGYLFYLAAELKISIPEKLKVNTDVLQVTLNYGDLGRNSVLRILNWWTFCKDNQPLPPFKELFQVEHIFAKKNIATDNMRSTEWIDSLGNLALLEQSINSKASNKGFADKRQYYLGTNKRKGTINQELVHLAETHETFTEHDIKKRDKEIKSAVFEFIKQEGFLK